jgi:GNAT superfamily N-acetyltransferase
MELIYRDGVREDSQRLAELISIASGGIVDFLFHDLLPGMSPVQALGQALEADHYPHSFRNTAVAVHDSEIVGMTLSYPSEFYRVTDEMKGFFPSERLEHLRHFYDARVDGSWFLDAICVDTPFQRKGIGTQLVDLAKRKAQALGYHALSLLAFADNSQALRVYDRAGFEPVSQAPLQRDRLIPHEGGCLLLKCNI